MPLKEAGEIGKIFNKINRSAEQQLIKNENKSFAERKNSSMEKASNILENANMTTIATDLLEKFPLRTIDNMTEEELDVHCAPYDAAVIVALCKRIEINKKEAT